MRGSQSALVAVGGSDGGGYLHSLWMCVVRTELNSGGFLCLQSRPSWQLSFHLELQEDWWEELCS